MNLTILKINFTATASVAIDTDNNKTLKLIALHKKTGMVKYQSRIRIP